MFLMHDMPVVPICLKNYNRTVNPCRFNHGHGACEKCLDTLFTRHTNPKCPIVEHTYEQNTNYDLGTITSRVTLPTREGAFTKSFRMKKNQYIKH